MVLPLLGFLFCSVIWLGLGSPAKIAGGLWLGAGFFVLAAQRAGFKRQVVLSDPSSYE